MFFLNIAIFFAFYIYFVLPTVKNKRYSPLFFLGLNGMANCGVATTMNHTMLLKLGIDLHLFFTDALDASVKLVKTSFFCFFLPLVRLCYQLNLHLPYKVQSSIKAYKLAVSNILTIQDI
jgi:hypothetical protein